DSTYQGCTNGIGHIINGELKRFPDRACTGAGPESMALGSDGRIYVVEAGSDQIEFVGGRGPVGYAELDGKSGYAYPQYITSGSDGNLWISADRFVIRLSTNGYTAKYFRVGSDQYPPPNVASEIATGPDGNVWVIEKHYPSSTTSILKITPKGHVTPYRVKAPHNPMSLTPGPDGLVWFIDLAKPSVVGSVSPSGSFAYHPVENNLGAIFLTLGWNGGDALEVGGETKSLRQRRHFFTATVQ
ncbi:MAG TPA: hypothetical protein VJP76_03835, partial [Candidatus Tumulicola sp.]|nr:hypothetical protein [Candidatus Tumulicola sp.]